MHKTQAFYAGVLHEFEKVALGVSGHKDRGALWWKRREHYIGDNDKAAVDGYIKSMRAKHPGARVKRAPVEPGAGGRSWHAATITTKHAAAASMSSADRVRFVESTG